MRGRELRTGRFFQRESGATLMLAFDRTLLAGPCPHAGNAAVVLREFSSAPVEAILLSPGLTSLAAGFFNSASAPRIVTRIDFPVVADFAYHGEESHQMICTPEHAARLGADAVVMCLVSGYHAAENWTRNLHAVSEAADACARLGLPLIVEAVLWGGRHEDPREAEALARVCRIAAELGADIIKTQSPESKRTCAQLWKAARCQSRRWEARPNP